jgi:hypothetical protein
LTGKSQGPTVLQYCWFAVVGLTHVAKSSALLFGRNNVTTQDAIAAKVAAATKRAGVLAFFKVNSLFT